jgi:hypothetical protein
MKHIIKKPPRNYQFGGEIDITKYNTIIGAGGFGKIYRSDDGKSVVKLLYQGKCSDAKKEHDIHNKCYVLMKDYIKDNMWPSQTLIALPLEFSRTSFVKNLEKYDCGYSMSYIRNIGEYKIPDTTDRLYHLIFKDEYEGTLNKDVSRDYSGDISESNPSRGYFITTKFLKQLITKLPNKIRGDIIDINDILYRMGFLFGFLIFVCEYIPTDAEYVLSLNDKGLICITVLDFGMFTQIDMKNTDKKYIKDLMHTITAPINFDLYFPYADKEEFIPFIVGFTDIYKLSPKSPLSSRIYDRILKMPLEI